MLDTALRERCRLLNQLKIDERRKQLEVEISKVNASVGANGFSHPGGTCGVIYSLLCDEFEIRAKIAWSDIVTIHKAMGSLLTDTLNEE